MCRPWSFSAEPGFWLIWKMTGLFVRFIAVVVNWTSKTLFLFFLNHCKTIRHFQRHKLMLGFSWHLFSVIFFYLPLMSSPPFPPLACTPSTQCNKFGWRMCRNEWWRGTLWPIALLILTATKWFESYIQPIMEHCSKEKGVVLRNGTNGQTQFSDGIVQEHVFELNQPRNHYQLQPSEAWLRRTGLEPRLPSVLLDCVQCPWRCCSAGFSPSPSTCSDSCSWHCGGLGHFKSPRHFMLMIF